MTRKISVLALIAMFAIVGCSKKDDGKKKKDDKSKVKKDPKKDVKTDVKKDEKKDEKKEPEKKAEMVKPEIGVVVKHKVKDFDKFLKVFHSHYRARRKAGVLGHHVARGANNPNMVVVYLAGKSKERLEEMAKSDDLKKKMKEATVTGKPQMTWITPISSTVVADKTNKNAGVIITHKVKDYDAWRKVYDEAEKLRKDNGILGHAVARLVKKPNTVMVYHEAADVDTLRKFAKLKGLKAAMKKAGVVGKPQFHYVQTEHVTMYKKRGKGKKGKRGKRGMKKAEKAE